MHKLAAFVSASLFLIACSSQGSGHDDAGAGDLGAADDLSSVQDLASGCPRTPRGDDALRFILVSHPYTAAGAKAMDYEALSLDSTGKITQLSQHFTLGRAAFGTFSFTADGAFGYIAQDDGTIGIIGLKEGSPPTVIEAAHKDTYYAGGAWVGPAGDHLYLLDTNTDTNGGGIFDAPIACDGTLGTATKLSGADVPAALVALPGGDWALYARKLTGATSGQTAHRVQLGPPFNRIASATAFSTATDNAVIASSTRTHDGKWVLFGDNSEFSGVANRIAAVAVISGGLGAAQEITPNNDPVALVASPYDNVVLVVSGYDNAFRSLTYDPTNATAPFTAQGAITYMGAKPELPGGAILIERGALKGRVYVAENLGIRPLRFETSGVVTDLGKFSLGSGTENVVGAIGVTP